MTHIDKLDSEIECLRREIAAGKAGRTRVTLGWLRWARVELRRMLVSQRIHQCQHELATAYARHLDA